LNVDNLKGSVSKTEKFFQNMFSFLVERGALRWVLHQFLLKKNIFVILAVELQEIAINNNFEKLIINLINL
jgi:hypothetical protein